MGGVNYSELILSAGSMKTPRSGFDNILKFVLVLVTLVGCCVMRTLREHVIGLVALENMTNR